MDNKHLRMITMDYCKNNGIKKSYLSTKLGLNKNTLYHWFRGEFNLSEDKLNLLIAIVCK